MNDKFAELYEKIVSTSNWSTNDLDRLVELAKAEGYESGTLHGKHLLRECYNVINNSTGLDISLPKPKRESSLSRRVREFINE